MHDEMDGDFRLAEDDAQRIHEKGHVVGHDHDERVGALEAGALAGIEHLDERLPRTPCAAAKFEMLERRAREHLRRTLPQVLFRNSAKIGAQEFAPQGGAGARSRARAACGDDPLDQGAPCGGDVAQRAVATWLSGHAHESRSRSRISAARNLAASPPVTQR